MELYNTKTSPFTNVIIVSDKLTFFFFLGLSIHGFLLYNFYKEKKKKESPRNSGGFKIRQVFFEKILPQ